MVFSVIEFLLSELVVSYKGNRSTLVIYYIKQFSSLYVSLEWDKF